MMTNYWVTFRIEHDAGYQERYDGMMEAVGKVRKGFWPEPTSFFFIESELEIDGLMKSITKPLNPKADLMVARYLGKEGSRYFGAVEHLDVLKSFLPSIKKV